MTNSIRLVYTLSDMDTATGSRQREFSFLRGYTSMGARKFFHIPAEVGRFLSKDQVYEITLRPVGTILVMRTG